MTENKIKTLLQVPRLKVIWNIPKILRNPIEVFGGYFRQYGENFKLKQRGVEIFFSQKAEVVEHIFQKNHRNYWKPNRQKNLLGEYLGKGLLTSDGDYWLQQRRLIQPGFRKQNMSRYTDLMQKEIDQFDRHLQELATNQEIFDVTHEMMGITFRIITSCISSKNYDQKTLSRIEYIETEIMEHIAKTGRLPFLKKWYKRTGEDDRIQKLSKESDDLIYEVIDERIASKTEHDDILDMLLQIRYEDTNEGMTRQQLLDELKILIAAGHETTANALSWTLHLLAQHPEIEARLLEEIHEVLGNEKSGLAHLPKLEYTKMVIQEGMRLYPPAWITDRVALDDDEVDGINIPKNSIVVSFIYGIHRNPAYWEHPDQFMPSRFSKANMKGRKKFTYLPFGGGPRLCIGNNFAIMEMQLILVHFIRKYKWKLVPNQKIEYQPLITLRPRNGIQMQISQRDTAELTNHPTHTAAQQKEGQSKCPFH